MADHLNIKLGDRLVTVPLPNGVLAKDGPTTVRFTLDGVPAGEIEVQPPRPRTVARRVRLVGREEWHRYL